MGVLSSPLHGGILVGPAFTSLEQKRECLRWQNQTTEQLSLAHFLPIPHLCILVSSLLWEMEFLYMLGVLATHPYGFVAGKKTDFSFSASVWTPRKGLWWALLGHLSTYRLWVWGAMIDSFWVQSRVEGTCYKKCVGGHTETTRRNDCELSLHNGWFWHSFLKVLFSSTAPLHRAGHHYMYQYNI